MNLVPFQQDGFELVIDTNTGESFASIRAFARMCDRDESTIRKFGTAENWELKSAEIDTPKGLRSAALLNEDQMLEAALKYNPELLRKFAKLGLRKFLHELVGYKSDSSTNVLPSDRQLNLLRISQLTHHIELMEKRIINTKMPDVKQSYQKSLELMLVELDRTPKQSVDNI